ncbi:AMP-binding protein [Pasteurellaceae bacterium RH1A]|nr:AMP-binding protein [Pasteurellaceae bacterium RH1A]
MNYQADSLIAQFPSWTYADFEQKALKISAQLQADGVQALAVWLEDGAKLACLLLGAWQAGVKVLFPPNATPESVEWVKQHAQIWVTDSDFDQPNTIQFDSLGEAIDLQKIAHLPPLVDYANQTELWLKTSGSTGEAKTIVKTAQQMWLGAEALAQALPFPAENQITAISTVSIQHIYGLTVHIMMSLVKGWQIGRKQQFFPESMLAEVGKAQGAVVISSPAMLTRIDWQNTRLPQAMKGVISSGGALPEAVSQQMRDCLQAPVIEIYGSTETGPIAIRDDVHLWQTLPKSQLGSDDNGTLWIEAVWLSGREQTADVVEFAGTGFTLLGRADRIVKIGDKRTSLTAIENQLNQQAFVDDCYIAQHPEQPRLAAWVGLNQEGINFLREKGRRALIEALKVPLAEHQEKSAIPRFWRFTDKLPRNSQSKINKLEFNRICLEQVKDPLWLREENQGDQLTAVGKVPLDLVYLKDHFASFPLVPGVIELQWIADKANQWLGKELDFARLDKLKFQKFVRPNDEFELSLKWDESKGKLTFQMKVEGEACCSGVGIVIEE